MLELPIIPRVLKCVSHFEFDRYGWQLESLLGRYRLNQCPGMVDVTIES